MPASHAFCSFAYLSFVLFHLNDQAKVMQAALSLESFSYSKNCVFAFNKRRYLCDDRRIEIHI